MFGAIAGGIASALAGGAMSKLFGGGQKAASKQFRHGATSKSRSNTASNSTKHKSRSEERRVGKECRSRWVQQYQTKKKPSTSCVYKKVHATKLVSHHRSQ